MLNASPRDLGSLMWLKSNVVVYGGLLGLALASDARTSEAHAQAAADVGGWRGFYVGGSVAARNTRETGSGPFPLAQMPAVIAGYHVTSNSVVFGIEGEVSPSVEAGMTAALRGRLGYDLGPALLYVALGRSWTTEYGTTAIAGLGGNLGDPVHHRSSMSGIEFGVGAEIKLNASLAARAEARFVDYGSRLVNESPVHFDDVSLRIGLVYQLSSHSPLAHPVG